MTKYEEILKQREEWLKTLKEGDTVVTFRDNNWFKATFITKYAIKKITPKGSIRLNNDVLLNKDGSNYNKGVIIQPYNQSVKDYEDFALFINIVESKVKELNEVITNRKLSRYYKKGSMQLPSKEQQQELVQALNKCCNLVLDIQR